MKIKRLIFILITFLGIGAQAASVLAPICAKVHGGPILLDRFSLQVLKIQNGKKLDTTSLRQELKFVVPTAALKEQIHALSDIFGSRMQSRDKAPDGYVNVTSTYYLTSAKYKTLRGDTKKAKVRFRKYYLRDLTDIRSAKMQVGEGLRDRSWLELKIQHPDHANVVTKPRLLVLDRDIRFFTTDSFVVHKENLKNRLLELNPGKEEEVLNAIQFFSELYSNPRRRVENLFAKTEYDRESISTKLQNGQNPKEKIDVQFTMDQNIHLTRLADKERFDVYSPHETVIEVKIPVAYAEMTDADIALIPELARIKEFVEWLTEHHNRSFPINKGKMSKISKDGVDKSDKENSEHFLDVLDDLGS